MNDPWEDLAEWWLAEVESDPSYQKDVVPLLESLVGDVDAKLVLDLGCGEGRIMGILGARGARVVGCDLNEELARHAARHGPSLVGRLPRLTFFRSGTFEGVVSVLVLEHIASLDWFMAEAARVTKPGGWFTAVLNHPVYTAPESAPIVDPTDGELLWRWGRYLSEGATEEEVRGGSVTFYHRPLAEVLNSAWRAGWLLEESAERSISPATVPALGDQQQFPRLLGIRWRKAENPSSRGLKSRS